MVEHDRPSRFPAQAPIFAAYFGWMARRGADDALTGGFRRAQGSGLGWGRYQLAAVKDAHTTGLDGRGSKDDVRYQKAQTADSRQQTADKTADTTRAARSKTQAGPLSQARRTDALLSEPAVEYVGSLVLRFLSMHPCQP